MTTLQNLNNRIATLEFNFKEIMDNLKILNIRMNKYEENILKNHTQLFDENGRGKVSDTTLTSSPLKKRCQLCLELSETPTRHHIVPIRIKEITSHSLILCEKCHRLLHRAEHMGIVKLPQTNEEYRKWKSEMKEIDTERIK